MRNSDIAIQGRAASSSGKKYESVCSPYKARAGQGAQIMSSRHKTGAFSRGSAGLGGPVKFSGKRGMNLRTRNPSSQANTSLRQNRSQKPEGHKRESINAGVPTSMKKQVSEIISKGEDTMAA